jgi:sarcosine oxidase subunit alpha
VRLPPQPSERLDRSREVSFRFEGSTVRAFAGDTIGSALYASGRRVFSRSFKYHRPRGLLCCSGRCPNCLMQVDGVPNVRVCLEPVRENADVRAQNVLGSLDRDLLGVVDKVGGPFTPVGFYYRTMIRPRRAWPLYERLLRNLAGLGRIDPDAHRSGRFDTEHRRLDVLVIGAGEAGLRAAAAAASEGCRVLLVDEQLDRADLSVDPDVDVLAPASALGIYEGGLVPVAAGGVLYRVRADRIVVATGTIEQPLLFPNNDLVGVMLPGAIRRLVHDWAVKPDERAVVIAADDRGLAAAADLRTAGTDVVRVVDLRERSAARIVAKGRRGRVVGVKIDGEELSCDLLVASGGRQPAYSLLAQAGARIEYAPSLGVFVPSEIPAGVEAVGSVTGDGLAQAVQPTAAGKGRCFVCLCEDVTDKDVRRAIQEGFDSIELAKRYTTVTMGPCQGKLCHLPAIRLYSRELGRDEAAIGTTTARPPWQPVPLGLLAGRAHEPARRTPLHRRHLELGATMMWAGPWQRPHSYGDPADEVRAVHDTVGVIDVSTLGKLLVEGPDAIALLERLYPNRFADLGTGRVRYTVLSTDGGRIMDDGTVTRLGDRQFYVTTTSTGSEGVLEWFEWWNAVWQLEASVTDLTGVLAAVNVAGPRARELLARLTELDLTADAFAYLDARQARVAEVPCLLLRIGFVGELGYELHCASPYARHLWDAVLEAGADLEVRPFGLEPQRVLRLEKQHIIVGQDTDSESNVLEAGMPWVAKLDKDDFVGKWSLDHVQRRSPRDRLVGFEMTNGVVPPEGAQVVVAGKPSGRVTSARWSDKLGKAIGLVWVPAALAREDAAFDLRIDRRLEQARVRLQPFYDPEGERLRS